MTTLKDKLDDEKIEEIEERKTESKREKTKYGTLIEESDD